VPFDFCYTWLKAVVVRSILFSHLHPNSTIQFQRRETSLPLWRVLRSRVSCRVVGRRLYPCLCLCLPLSLSLIDIHGFRFSRCFGRSLSPNFLPSAAQSAAQSPAPPLLLHLAHGHTAAIPASPNATSPQPGTPCPALHVQPPPFRSAKLAHCRV
jgi:hypothetical protein